MDSNCGPCTFQCKIQGPQFESIPAKQTMEYIGEHLFPGRIGHLCIVLSFVAALLSSFAYFVATQRRKLPESEGWRSIGRFSFLLHGLATFGIIGSLFYILAGKMYEYEYAWANVSDDLPVQYVF